MRYEVKMKPQFIEAETPEEAVKIAKLRHPFIVTEQMEENDPLNPSTYYIQGGFPTAVACEGDEY